MNANLDETSIQNALKMGANGSAENTSRTPKKFRPIYPIGPYVWEIVEKRLHKKSIFCGLYYYVYHGFSFFFSRLMNNAELTNG